MATPQLSLSIAGLAISAIASGPVAAVIDSKPVQVSVTQAGADVSITQTTIQIGSFADPVEVSIPQQNISVSVSLTGSGGGQSLTPRVVDLDPTDGQTSFLLPSSPVPFTLHIVINSASLHYGRDFTLSGDTVLILPALGYAIAASDSIQARYLES